MRLSERESMRNGFRRAAENKQLPSEVRKRKADAMLKFGNCFRSMCLCGQRVPVPTKKGEKLPSPPPVLSELRES